MKYGEFGSPELRPGSAVQQIGWAFFSVDRGDPLLTVEAESGQLVLKDTSGAIRWSLSVVDRGEHCYVGRVREAGKEEPFFNLTLTAGASGIDPRPVRLRRLAILDAAANNKEFVAVDG